MYINLKELDPIVLTDHRWGQVKANKRVTVMSDTVSCVNRGTSRSPLLMTYLRYMFWLSAVYNFRLTAMHVPVKTMF